MFGDLKITPEVNYHFNFGILRHVGNREWSFKRACVKKINLPLQSKAQPVTQKKKKKKKINVVIPFVQGLFEKIKRVCTVKQTSSK